MWHHDSAAPDALRKLAADFAPMLGMAPEHIFAAAQAARSSAAAELSLAPAPAHSGTRLLLAGMTDLHAAARARPEQRLSMALETMHQGLSFTRSLAFLHDQSAACYAAGIGFGEVAGLMHALQFGDLYQSDVFHAALASDRVIFIRHAHDRQFANRLPAWWSTALGDAGIFVIAPLLSQGKPVGLLYGDWIKDAPPLLGPEHFAALDQLRTMAADACAAMARAKELKQAARVQLADA
jgi:hypothetical protein